MKKKTIARILIAGLLVFTIILASTRSPLNYYPLLQMEVTEPTQTPADMLTVSFLFRKQGTLNDCEALTGKIARELLKNCPQCRVKNIQCESTLDEDQRRLLSYAPLDTPSVQMPDGVASFTATPAELALSACHASETQSLTGSTQVRCFPANTARTSPAATSILSLWGLAWLISAFAAAWITGWLIVKYEHLHAHLSHDHAGSGPQKYHTQPTPRIGGLTLLAGMLATSGVMLLDNVPTEREFGLLLIASAPAFLGGLVEDLTKQVGVLKRLLLTMLSGAAAAWLLGAVVNRIDISGADQVLQWLPFAVLFTSFAVGGVANALNIIDGYNGLAGGFAVIILTAMAYVAAMVGDSLVFGAALALIGALLGFLVWNWPCGKVFLGDGGAYLLGYLLAELSVLLVARNPEVSPWFPMLLLIYPVFETVFSVYRRGLKERRSPGQPDNLHLHQMIYRYIGESGLTRLKHNDRVAKYLWLPAVTISVLGCAFWRNTGMLMAASAAFSIAYVAAYRWLANNRTLRRAPAESN
jgi:UDP-N-acetylmuramyl pentapeptide phosphotransferase/UDP-N-acetylglucosamine-1-phosphate transferase